jgi:hypothetical protein
VSIFYLPTYSVVQYVYEQTYLEKIQEVGKLNLQLAEALARLAELQVAEGEYDKGREGE